MTQAKKLDIGSSSLQHELMDHLIQVQAATHIDCHGSLILQGYLGTARIV
jgi:hypothetical protein